MHRKNFNVIGVLLIGFFLISSCAKEERQSKMAGILEFSIPGLNVPFVVNQFARSAFNRDSVPYTVDLRALKAEFTPTPGAVLKVGDVVQESGVTANDFRMPVTYTVVAEDGKTMQTYTVRVVATLNPIAVTWRKVSETGYGSFPSVSGTVFNGRLYAAAINPGAAWGLFQSGDGNSWPRLLAVDQQNDSIPSATHSRLVAGIQGKLWLLGGLVQDAVINKIWSTEDGIKWTLSNADTSATERWAPRERLNAVVFRDRLWVIGGNQYPAGGNPALNGIALNDVWSSANGLAWTKVTAAAAFPARSNPAVFVYKNRIWLTGGIDNNKQYLNDVWYTEDGATWTKVTTQTAPPLRDGHKVLVNKDQLLLIGGASAGTVHGNLWVSADDGVNWVQITNPEDPRVLPGAFPPRAYFEAFVSGKTIWVMGGLGPDMTTPVQQVWTGQMN